MRLVSYTLAAVLVAFSMAGCSGGAGGTSSTSGKRGVETSTFKITVRGEYAYWDASAGTTVILPGGGVVTSSAGGINCGYSGGAALETCVGTFTYGTKGVVLTATPDATNGYGFYEFAGACLGSNPCSVDVTSDRLVVIRFAKTAVGLGAHPNFSAGEVHGPLYVNGALPCAACHGSSLQGQGLAPGCNSCHSFPAVHAAGSDCASCHTAVAAQWSSAGDRHAASAADVLLNVDHDSSELLVDACLNCHSMFQRVAGMTIDQFVTPIDTVVALGQVAPDGTWTLLPGASAWQMTRCEVCHDATSTATGKLAKYGAFLDADPVFNTTTYFTPAMLESQFLGGPPTQMIFDGTSAYSAIALAAPTVGVDAVALCYSCHQWDDQGGDPNKVIGSVDYGPQGGDSRAFVTASHAYLTCIDCHPTHDFQPISPALKSACGGASCHDADRSSALPGVVHTNHIP
jgi:hypothetical protein